MANKEIKADELEKELSKRIKIYSDEVSEKVFKVTKKTMAKFVKKTKELAPRSDRKDRIHFADCITSKTEKDELNGAVGTWYVKPPNAWLTHLLEYGHQNRNGTRTPGKFFINKSYDEIAKEYVEELKKVIEND